MLHILHGEHTVASRSELNKLRERHADNEVIMLDGRSLELLNLKQALESQSLFNSNRLIIIENFFKRFGGRKTKELDEFIKVLLQTDHEVILWEDREVSKTRLKKFPKSTDIAIFKPSQNIFRFLELLAPQKKSAILEYFSNLYKTEPVELIFYMIVRQIRLLLLTKEAKDKKISGLAPWQKARLTNQAKHFTTEQLLASYQHLLNIDSHQKRGLSPFDLTQEIRQFLIQL